MVTAPVLLLAGIIIIQRLAELQIAEKNRKWALTQGAREFGRKHYYLFFLLHGGWLASWITEALVRGQISPYWPGWLFLFIMAQGLRYWCIGSLGRYWNTRILVIAGARAVKKGPYRWLNHPNYLAVAAELLCVPLLFDAWITAAATTAINAALIAAVRLPAENKALKLLQHKT